MSITLTKFKNRILSLCDTSANFINNIDSDAFTNICNDTQYELFRTLYTIYGEDMAQTNVDYTVVAGLGYYDFTNTIVNGYYTGIEGSQPFAIFRIDHLVGTRRIPMKRFTIANEILDTTPMSWESCNVRYDWRPPRIYFDPINDVDTTFRMYYVPKPTVLTSADGYIHWITEEHMELATIMASMKVFAKSETPTTEFQRLYDQYITNLKLQLPRDHGQHKPIQDVQSLGNIDPFNREYDWRW